MKKIITFIAIAVVGLLHSCGDILDILPVSNNSAEEFYANDREIQQGLMGVYARLGRNGSGDDFPSIHYLELSESRSDNWFVAQAQNAQRDQSDARLFRLTPTTTLVATSFNRLYALIASANSLIANVPETGYERVVAEARFLRAYAYFELVRSWGPVPIVTEPIEKTDAPSYQRQPATEVYTQIVKDLEYAIANLGEAFYTGAEAGRVGTWAARTMLAYVYVTMAGYPVNDGTAYQKAADVLSPVINNMNSRFAPTYPQIFSLPEENKWDLFSVQFQSGNTGLGSSLVGYSTGGGGSQETIFPEWVYSSYTLQGQDFRVDSLFVRPMVNAGDTRGMDPILIEYYKDKDGNTIHKPFQLTKYLVRDKTNAMIKAWNDYPLNCPILRVSDAYLLYAEALVNTGKAGEAKQWVDKVRERAGIPALTANPTMADVFDERRKEFIGEGKRYYDLIRQGETVFINSIKALSDHYGHVVTYNAVIPTTKDMLLPIPQPVMNVHTDWTQNPGY